VRYRAIITRVQTAERFVRAEDREAASAKLADELARPYAFLGTWDSKVTDIDLVEAEEPAAYKPLAKDGTLLLSLKEAAALLGLSYNTLYGLVVSGELEHVQIGTRRYLSREQLARFIEGHTRRCF
jgi:excisionase family DNA binding protein